MALEIEAGSRSKMRSKVQFSHCVSLIGSALKNGKRGREMNGILKPSTKKLFNVCPRLACMNLQL